MNIVVDTSVIIAVITNEPHKKKMIEMTKEADLIAPSSLHWEVGNAFSAMFKRKRITLAQSMKAIQAYKKIPIRFSDVELETAIELAESLGIYAYDAYFLGCALKHKSALLSLDRGLLDAAEISGIKVSEVIL